MPAKTRVLKLGRLELKYGVASPSRYHMQARALTWQMLKYPSLTALAYYAEKFTKILLFFEKKGEYLSAWHKGTKEGIALWRKRR